MKHLSIILILYSNSIFGQLNLIQNGSFEDITSCPDAGSQIEKATGWFSATQRGTPDLFNQCATDTIFTVPSLFRPFISYQNAKTGVGFSGIYVYSGNNDNPPYEYIETKLLNQLVKNKTYYVRFFTNPKYVMSPPNIGSGDAFINQLGMAITKDRIYDTSSSQILMSIHPQIEYKGPIIDDTLNWTKISGCFKAKGDESYLTIGNFTENSKTLFSQFEQGFPIAYLFIEDAGLYEFNPLPDTIYLCNGAPQTFNAHFLDATSYHWSSGKNDSIETINKEGKYYVEVNIDNCTLSDSTFVIDTKNIPSIYHINLCSRDSKILISPIIGEYSWSDGSMDKQITITKEGLYKLHVSNTCDEFDFLFNVAEQECECNAFMPSAFSPNGDGLNDDLNVLFSCGFNIDEMQFLIMDRFGNNVFNTFNTTWGWDGKYKSINSEIGTYFYLLRYSYIKDGQKIITTQKGNIILIR